MKKTAERLQSLQRRGGPAGLARIDEPAPGSRTILVCLTVSRWLPDGLPREPRTRRVGRRRRQPWFEEIAARAGIDFVHHSGHDSRHYLPEIMGGGAALFDMDNDGFLDLYLVQSGNLLDSVGRRRQPPLSQPRQRHVRGRHRAQRRRRSRLRHGRRRRRLRQRRLHRSVRHQLRAQRAAEERRSRPFRRRDREGRRRQLGLEHERGVRRLRRRRRARSVRRPLPELAAVGRSRVFQPDRRARLLQSGELRPAVGGDAVSQQRRRHVHRRLRAVGRDAPPSATASASSPATSTATAASTCSWRTIARPITSG